MSAALAYRADASEAALVFQIKDDAYNTDSLIEFLEQFHEHFSGEKVTLIWDGLSAHRSRAMKAWIATQRSWLVVEQLPGYAHDLNPVELVWGNVKAVEPRTCVPTPSRRRKLQPRMPSSVSAPATSSVSTSSTTPAFLCDHVLRVFPKDL